MVIYDVIIIGSGLGGLETAAVLGKKGFRVLVLEKNPQAGGALQSFVVNGCTFSAGMHYVGAIGKGSVLQKFFSYLGIYDDIELQPLDAEAYERFFIDGKEYRYPVGYNAFQEMLVSLFPREEKAVNAFVNKVKEVAAYQDIYNLRTPVNNNLFNNPYFKTGLCDYIETLTGNKELQKLLAAPNFVHAGEKESTPLYTHALILDHYLQGAYRFGKGSGQLVQLLKKVINDQGGTILTNSRVTSVTMTEKEIKQVVTESGEHFFAKNVISNVHPAATLDFLDNSLLKPVYIKRIKSLENSLSPFSLFITLKKGVLPYENYNRHYFLEDNVWPASRYNKEKWPQYFFVHHYVPDGGKYSKCISVITYMKYEEVLPFAGSDNGNVKAEYKEWKKRKAEKLLQRVMEKYPALKDAIETYNVATPLTFKRYLGSPTGSMYGIKRDFRNANYSNILPVTRIPGFYFTGQNINLHGMMGVTLSSLVTLGFFMDINQLIEEINEAS